MNAWVFVLWIFGSFMAGVFYSAVWDWFELRFHVQAAMKYDPSLSSFRHVVREARVLLALQGHRMSKRTRDALTVWLAEHDKAGEP